MSTTLAPLRLRGIATPLVESLEFYLCRLADAHHVSSKQLWRVITDGLTHKGPRGGSVRERCIGSVASYSPTTLAVVSRIEDLTGEPTLRCATFLKLANVLGKRYAGCIVANRRWCPECYTSESDLAYEPFYWSVPLVARCHIHDLPLSNRCGACGETQAFFRGLDLRRFCFVCREPLTASAPGQRLTAWQLWVQSHAMELLATCSDPEVPEPAEGSFARFALALRRRAAAGYRDGRRPLLETVFKLAALQSRSPRDLLWDPEQSASPVLPWGEGPARPPTRRLAVAHGRVDRATKLMSRLLTGKRMLPSLRLVLQHCDVNPSTRPVGLSSELLQSYEARRTLQLLRLRERQLATATATATKMLRDAREMGVALQRKHCARALMTQLRVPKLIARTALRHACDSVDMTLPPARRRRGYI